MHKQIHKKEKAGLYGVYTITKAILEKPEHFALNDRIIAARDAKDAVRFRELVAELNRICRTEKIVVKNIVPTVGRTLLANNLTAASPDNTPTIEWAEVGTSTQAPANSDTALIASSYRNAIASITNASNIAYATAFFGATEVTGTLREAGIFCDGTASAGTGVLLSRVAINVTKSSVETLTIDWTLTIT